VLDVERADPMKTLQKVLLVLGALVLIAQLLRLIYIMGFESRTSVLDKYTKTGVQNEIEGAQSLDELLAMYEQADRRYDELDGQRKDLSEEEKKKFNDEHSEELGERLKLDYAIRDWERKTGEITELRVFWTMGLILVLGGGALYWKRWRWLGMALIVPGFTEMIWWTTPSLVYGGAAREFDRLMNNRLFFTLLSLLVLTLVWVLKARIQAKNEEAEY
jgi:hypothetical protein